MGGRDAGGGEAPGEAAPETPGRGPRRGAGGALGEGASLGTGGFASWWARGDASWRPQDMAVDKTSFDWELRARSMDKLFSLRPSKGATSREI